MRRLSCVGGLICVFALAAAAPALAAPAWVSPASTLSSGGTVQDLQVASDAGGDSVAVWSDGSNIWEAEQPAGGSWTTASEVASTTWGIGATDSVGISSSGKIYVFFGTSASPGFAATVASKQLGASGWTLTALQSGSGVQPTPVVGAVNASGQGIVAWQNEQHPNTSGYASATWYYSTLAAGGSSWSSPAELGTDNDAYGANSPSLAIDASGDAALVWTLLNNGGCFCSTSIQGAELTAGGAWTTPNALSSATSSGTSGDTVALDSSGNATATWIRNNGTNTIVQYATKSLSATSWPTAAASGANDLSSTSSSANAPALAVDPGGATTIGWTTQSANTIRDVTRSTPTGSFGSVTPIPTTDTSPSGLVLVPGGDGSVDALWSGTNSSSQQVVSAARQASGASSFTDLPDVPGTANASPAAADDDHGDVTAAWINSSSSSVVQASRLIVPAPTVSNPVDDASTNLAWSGSEVTGASAYDTSTVSGAAGTPTGSVTYELFSGGSCAGSPLATSVKSLNGGGSVPNSSSTSPLGAGTYSFQASYSGDGNYASATKCTSFTVGQVAPSVSSAPYDAGTNSPWSGDEAAGASAYDTSAVSGAAGVTPTGSVTYKLYDNTSCSGTALSSDTATLAGDGTVPHSSTTQNLGKGNYSYLASYSGDSSYTSGSDCQSFSVGRASPTLSSAPDDAGTNGAWSGSETTGAKAFDTSTIAGASGTPTGTVTYQLFTGSTCSGSTVGSSSVKTVAGDGSIPNSDSTSSLAAGTYSFLASYSGDLEYTPASSCSQFTVGEGTPTVSSSPVDADSGSAWSGAETTGASAYDTSQVVGAGGVTPTGSVTYEFFTNSSCTGSPVASNNRNLNGDGSVPQSPTQGPLSSGSYSFRVTYSGDGNYQAGSPDCQAISVSLGSPSLTVGADDAATNLAWSGDENPGSSSYGTASLSPTSAGVPPTGSVIYSLYDNGTCSGTAASTSTKSLNGDGSVPNSDSSAALTAGSYSYNATYAGDGNYSGASSNCASFRVNGPPQATIGSPAGAKIYAVGQKVSTTFSCSDPNGPGIASCVDSGNGSGGKGHLVTSAPGDHTYTVTATSEDDQVTQAILHYKVAAAPKVTLVKPAKNATYSRHQSVLAKYTCQEGKDGPGIKSCQGTVANGKAINTATAGRHTFTVVAISKDGQKTTEQITYTVK